VNAFIFTAVIKAILLTDMANLLIQFTPTFR
jgi:hypothetical protein